MSIVWSVTTGVAASAIFALIISLGSYLLGRGRYRRVWRIDSHRGATVRVVAGTVGTPLMELGYRHATTAGTDAVAIGNLCSALTLAYRSRYKFTAACSVAFHDSFWDDPLVLVGGQVRNIATRDALAQAKARGFQFPYHVNDVGVEKRHIIDAGSGEQFESRVVGERMVEDYGLIYCMPSPFNPSQRSPIFIFYGLHAFGTVGVSRLVTSEYVREFMKTRIAPSSRWFQVLVRVHVRDEDTFPEVVGAREIVVPPDLFHQRARPLFGSFLRGG